MSPSGQPNSASRRSKIVRQTSIVPIVQTEPGAVGLVAAKKRRRFDPHAFLATIAEGRRFVLFPRKREIFAQGDPADAVFYIQTGKVTLTVVSKTGKEVCTRNNGLVLRIEKKVMMEALHREHEFSDSGNWDLLTTTAVSGSTARC